MSWFDVTHHWPVKDSPRGRVRALLAHPLAQLVRKDDDFVGLADDGFNFVHLNAAARDLLGASDRDLERLRLLDPVAAEDRALVEAEAIERVLAGRPWRGDVRLRHLHSGRDTRVAFSVFPIFDADGRSTLGYAATARVAPEPQPDAWLDLVDPEKAERLEAVDRAFLMGVSHHVRTPLNAIMGFTDLARQPDLPPRELSECLDAIDRGATELARIADDVSDFVGLGHGRLVLAPREIVLDEFLADFGWLMALRARVKGIRFQLVSVGRLPRTISVDSVRLAQILRSAVGRAIGATERGFVRLDVSARDRELTFIVTDTGRSLTADERAKIFVPFARFEPGGDTAGLDLALALELCRRMGGDLRIGPNTAHVGSSLVARVLVDVPTKLRLVREDGDTPRSGGDETLPRLTDDADLDLTY